MTPEASLYLDKARQCLEFARIDLEVGLNNDAGRNAYLAAFHAAQALIFERTGKNAKTHNGVRSLFNSLAREEPGIEDRHRQFLSQAYDLKSLADYETGPEAVVPIEKATAAADDAERFVECVGRVI